MGCGSSTPLAVPPAPETTSGGLAEASQNLVPSKYHSKVGNFYLDGQMSDDEVCRPGTCPHATAPLRVTHPMEGLGIYLNLHPIHRLGIYPNLLRFRR